MKEQGFIEQKQAGRQAAEQREGGGGEMMLPGSLLVDFGGGWWFDEDIGICLHVIFTLESAFGRVTKEFCD